MDPLTIGIGLAKLIGPKVVKWVAGDTAGNVAEELVNHAGVITGESDPDTALKRLQADPDLLLKFRSRVMENEETLEELYLADRQSARQRDIEMHRIGYHNKRADLMVGIAFLCLMTIVACIWSYRDSIPGEVLGFMSTAAGALLKMLGDAFQFEFGSSRGSKEKDQLKRKEL